MSPFSYLNVVCTFVCRYCALLGMEREQERASWKEMGEGNAGRERRKRTKQDRENMTANIAALSRVH